MLGTRFWVQGQGSQCWVLGSGFRECINLYCVRVCLHLVASYRPQLPAGLITGGLPFPPLADCETCDYSISFSAEEPPEYSKATKYPVSCSCLCLSSELQFHLAWESDQTEEKM